MGKAHRLKFTLAKLTTNAKMDNIHSGIWGSSQVPSYSLYKPQYFIFSKKEWIYFLKSKDEALGKFLEQKVFIENQTEIARHHTCTGTPQQNGLAEKMNRTIIDKVRSILNESGLPK